MIASCRSWADLPNYSKYFGIVAYLCQRVINKACLAADDGDSQVGMTQKIRQVEDDVFLRQLLVEDDSFCGLKRRRKNNANESRRMTSQIDGFVSGVGARSAGGHRHFETLRTSAMPIGHSGKAKRR